MRILFQLSFQIFFIDENELAGRDLINRLQQLDFKLRLVQKHVMLQLVNRHIHGRQELEINLTCQRIELLFDKLNFD